MLSTERNEFETELKVLFGAFPSYLTDERKEAYWRGLQKMQLGMFKRCVERAIGEGGEEKLPTVHRMWEISHELRDQARGPMRSPGPQAEREVDVFTGYANRVLYWFLTSGRNATPDGFRRLGEEMRGAPSAKSLRAMLREKSRIADAYRSICTEEPEASLDMRDELLAAFAKHFEPMPASECAGIADHVARTGRVPVSISGDAQRDAA